MTIGWLTNAPPWQFDQTQPPLPNRLDQDYHFPSSPNLLTSLSLYGPFLRQLCILKVELSSEINGPKQGDSRV